MFEGLLALLAEAVTTYLPGSVLSAADAGSTRDLAWGTAVGLAAVHVKIGIPASLVAFTRRDFSAWRVTRRR